MASLNDKLSEFGPSAPEADQDMGGIYPDLTDVTRLVKRSGIVPFVTTPLKGRFFVFS